MMIENNASKVIVTMTPDEAGALSAIILSALRDPRATLEPGEQDLWAQAGDSIYYASEQAKAMRR